MSLLSILLVVDVTAGVVLGIVYLCTVWEARRRIGGTSTTLDPVQPAIVVPALSWEAEETTTGQRGLVVLPGPPDPNPDSDSPDDEADDDTEPEPETCAEVRDEWSGFPWFDARSCWGCERACKASRFHPYQGSNIGAEIRGACASRSRARAEEPYHAGFAPAGIKRQVGTEPSTSVASLWSSTCEACGRLVRRTLAGLEPSAVPMARVADAECPF